MRLQASFAAIVLAVFLVDSVTACAPVSSGNTTTNARKRRDISITQLPATINVLTKHKFGEADINDKYIKDLEAQLETAIKNQKVKVAQFGEIAHNVVNENGFLRVIFTFSQAHLHCDEFSRASQKAFKVIEDAKEAKISCEDASLDQE